jgi:hypothetical protein
MALSVRLFSPYLAAFSQKEPLASLLGALGTARHNVDIFGGTVAIETLVAEAARLRSAGVRVRWLVSPDRGSERLLGRHGFSREHDFRPVALAGRSAGAFCLIDGKRVVKGTMGFTPEAVCLEDNVQFVIDSQKVAEAFARSVESLWNYGEERSIQAVEGVTVGPEQRVSAYFNPFDGYDTIASAERIIHFALPTLDEPRLVEALEERARSGVHVVGVIDGMLSRSEHFQDAPTLRALLISGKIRMMRPFESRDRMNARLLAVDGRWTATGSCQSALVVESIPVARQCEAYIEALCDLARAGGHRREACIRYGEYRAGTAPGAQRRTAPPGASSWARRKARAAARRRVAHLRASRSRAA